MPALKQQIKQFTFAINVGKSYELPAHWTAFQVDLEPKKSPTHVVIWAYRNGNA